MLKIKKIKKTLKNFPWLVANHAFFSCLILFLLAVFFGVLIFYKYRTMSSSVNFKNIESFYMLDYDSYNSVLDARKKEENNLKQIDSKTYINPFNSGAKTEEVD